MDIGHGFKRKINEILRKTRVTPCQGRMGSGFVKVFDRVKWQCWKRGWWGVGDGGGGGTPTGISYGSHVGPIWTALWAPLGRPTSDPKQSVRRAEMGPKWATHVGYQLTAQNISSGR